MFYMQTQFSKICFHQVMVVLTYFEMFAYFKIQICCSVYMFILAYLNIHWHLFRTSQVQCYGLKFVSSPSTAL